MESNSGRRRRRSSAYGISIEQDRSRSVRSGRRKGAFLAGLIQSTGLGFLVYLVRRVYWALHGFFSLGWILSLPIGILLLLTSTDFLVLTSVTDVVNSVFFDELGVTVNDARREAAELLKARILSYVYLFILCLGVFHWRKVSGYLKHWKHWLFLLACLLSGTLVSIDGAKVFTNTALIAIGLLSAILFALANAGNRNFNPVYLYVLVPMLLLHLASLGIFFLYESHVGDLVDFVFSSRRFGGLAGNPNSLGATAVMGYWAAMCLFLSRQVSAPIRLLATVSIVLFILHVLMSGSGTSVIAMILVTIALFWLRMLSIFKPVVRNAVNAGAAVVAALAVLLVVFFANPADLFFSLTDTLGKDETLTGRTDLWQIARDAISVKPFFGWGFDSHASVMAESAFDIPYNHYHNGYLDTLVAGGAVLLLLVMYNLGRFCRAFFLAFRLNPDVFPLIVPLIVLLFFNLSEYSLLRPNSQVWAVYVLVFVMLTYDQRDQLLWRFTPKRKTPGARSRKRQLRWA